MMDWCNDGFSIIVCIGLSPPPPPPPTPLNTIPFILAKPPLNLQTGQDPRSFYAVPLLYIGIGFS